MRTDQARTRAGFLPFAENELGLLGTLVVMKCKPLPSNDPLPPGLSAPRTQRALLGGCRLSPSQDQHENKGHTPTRRNLLERRPGGRRLLE